MVLLLLLGCRPFDPGFGVYPCTADSDCVDGFVCDVGAEICVAVTPTGEDAGTDTDLPKPQTGACGVALPADGCLLVTGDECSKWTAEALRGHTVEAAIRLLRVIANADGSPVATIRRSGLCVGGAIGEGAADADTIGWWLAAFVLAQRAEIESAPSDDELACQVDRLAAAVSPGAGSAVLDLAVRAASVHAAERGLAEVQARLQAVDAAPAPGGHAVCPGVPPLDRLLDSARVGGLAAALAGATPSALSCLTGRAAAASHAAGDTALLPRHGLVSEVVAGRLWLASEAATIVGSAVDAWLDAVVAGAAQRDPAVFGLEALTWDSGIQPVATAISECGTTGCDDVRVDPSVVVVPAALALTVLGPAADDNAATAVCLAADRGLVTSGWGPSDAIDFGEGLVDRADARHSVRAVAMMAVALLDRKLGGGALEDLLRVEHAAGVDAWSAALELEVLPAPVRVAAPGETTIVLATGGSLFLRVRAEAKTEITVGSASYPLDADSPTVLGPIPVEAGDIALSADAALTVERAILGP